MTINSLNRAHIIYGWQHWTGQYTLQQVVCPSKSITCLWGTNISANSTLHCHLLCSPLPALWLKTSSVLISKGSIMQVHHTFSWPLPISHRHQTACTMDASIGSLPTVLVILSYSKRSALPVSVCLFGWLVLVFWFFLHYARSFC